MILYLDCLRGINAVSALAALIDAGAPAGSIADRVRPLPGTIDISISETRVDGLRARTVEVAVAGIPDARGLEDAVRLIEAAELSERTRTRLIGVYERLATAEATVHGTTREAVTFREVGSMRSVVAVIALGSALDLLDVREVVVSPLVVGGGVVETHHGRLSVPAPATLELLREVPVRRAATDGELLTPTGAALAAGLASSFGPMPSMTVERIGYGTDDRRSPMPVTRAIAGPPAPDAAAAEETSRPPLTTPGR